jgi:DNA-binding MarR family transcriptional regulator
MSSTMTDSHDLEARTAAVRALEGEFGELLNQFRQIVAENAHRLSPGLLPGAYKVFTTIARRERVTVSALAESLLMDKGQLSRTVRELEHLGLVQRAADPADGRSSLLSPTAEGLERLADARRPYESSLVTRLADWPVEEIEHFTRLLGALSSGTTP